MLANVGQWPKERAIRRISHIEVYSGWVVDSVRITYDMMAGGTKTVQHGGPGGSKKLDISLAGNILFYFSMFKFDLLTPLELQKTIISLLFMVAGSMRLTVTMAVKSMCPGLLTFELLLLKLMCFPHSASSSCRSSSQRVARQVRMPLRALLTV